VKVAGKGEARPELKAARAFLEKSGSGS
jgi:hypothetical protein